VDSAFRNAPSSTRSHTTPGLQATLRRVEQQMDALSKQLDTLKPSCRKKKRPTSLSGCCREQQASSVQIRRLTAQPSFQGVHYEMPFECSDAVLQYPDFFGRLGVVANHQCGRLTFDDPESRRARSIRRARNNGFWNFHGNNILHQAAIRVRLRSRRQASSRRGWET